MFRRRLSECVLVFVAPLLVFGARPISAEEADEWWSWQPLERPEVPSGGAAGRERESKLSDLDRHILAALRDRGMTLSGEADAATLLRRIHFDLTGLPPSPEKMASFVADRDPRAYEREVDRLLDSPRYGERWARHWLDVVHYGETHGYDKDKPRPNAYPYRDYVIRSFNDDKPYARFIKEQLAGDVLWPDTVDGVVATGFLAAGPWDFIGHAEVPEEKIDGKVARHLDRDDMVTTTMNAFCSLTVQCAQCHQHKGDPVSMEDYYALQAVFAALDRTDRDYDPDPKVAQQRFVLKQMIEELGKLISELEGAVNENRSPGLQKLDRKIAQAEEVLLRSVPREDGERSPHYGYHSQVASAQDVVKWVQFDLGQEMIIDRVALFAADEYGFADFGFPHRFRVEVSSGSEFAESDEVTMLVAHEEADFPRPGAHPVVVAAESGLRGRYVRVTASKLWNRRQKGKPLTEDWIFALGEVLVLSGDEPVPLGGGAVSALDSIESGERWGKRLAVDGVLGSRTLEQRAPNGIAALLDQDIVKQREELEELKEGRAALLAEEQPERVAELAALQGRLERDQQALTVLPKGSRVYVGTVHTGSGAFKGRGHVDGLPRPIHVLYRGDVTRPGPLVAPAAIPGIVGERAGAFTLEEGHREGQRRLALAEWIAHPENKLTWRSIVNRVWHYHFGRGLVDTLNDFGRLGSRPSHPELLDWLAVTFRDGGGSIKDLHRLIMNSAVYKQSSATRSDYAAIDGSNQYLWRQNRRRLEAEAVRDSVLLVAGKLDLTMYGPSFMDFVIEKPEHSPHYEYHKADPADPKTHRRSIYRFLVRSQPQPFMDTLDCADPSELVDKRGETNTALQALAMLNNQFMVHLATCFAERVEDHATPVRRAFQLALSRDPGQGEWETLKAYADEHGLAATCRVLFNLNEFTFVD